MSGLKLWFEPPPTPPLEISVDEMKFQRLPSGVELWWCKERTEAHEARMRMAHSPTLTHSQQCQDCRSSCLTSSQWNIPLNCRERDRGLVFAPSLTALLLQSEVFLFSLHTVFLRSSIDITANNNTSRRHLTDIEPVAIPTLNCSGRHHQTLLVVGTAQRLHKPVLQRPTFQPGAEHLLSSGADFKLFYEIINLAEYQSSLRDGWETQPSTRKAKIFITRNDAEGNQQYCLHPSRQSFIFVWPHLWHRQVWRTLRRFSSQHNVMPQCQSSYRELNFP